MDRLSGVTWRKSSYSGGNGGTCVEVADAGRFIAVRDSQDPDGPALSFTRAQWVSFTQGLEPGTADSV